MLPGVRSSEKTQLHVETLGVVVPLDVLGIDLASAVGEVWRDSLRHAEGGFGSATVAPPLSVAVGEWGLADVTGADISEVLHILALRVAGTAAARRSGDLVMLSAGAVAEPDSELAAVLVGNGPELTEAVTTLGKSLVFLSDHTTGITVDGLVVPALNPLRTPGRDGTHSQAPPSSLVHVPASGSESGSSYRITALIVLEHDGLHEGAPLVEPLDTIDALSVLAPGATSLGNLDRPVQRLADVVRRAGGARRVTYADADTLEPVVRELLAARVGR